MTARFVWNDSTDRQYKQGEKQDFESCLQNSTQPESATEWIADKKEPLNSIFV